MKLKLPQNNRGYHTFFVEPDRHIPYEDKKTCRAIDRYIDDVETIGGWDGYINLGDLADLNTVSSHNKNNLLAVEGARLQKDFDAVNRFWDNRNIQFEGKPQFWIQGNHEYRLDRYLQVHPELIGSLDFVTKCDLAKRGVTWLPFWEKGETLEIGNATFIHGLYTNKHHAEKHAQAYGRPVFYGHTHDLQQHSIVRNGDNKTVVGQSLGCVCDYRQSYMLGRPNRWQQAFGVFRFFPDGNFTYCIIPIFEHRFVSPDGEIYDGRKS